MNRRTPIFYRILDSFFRHLGLFAAVFLVVTTVTMGVLYSRSKMFTATALTAVASNGVGSQIGIQQYTGWTPPSQQNVNQFNDLMSNDEPEGFVDTALNGTVTATSELGNGIHKGDPLPSLKTKISMNPDDEQLATLRKRLTTFTQSDQLFGISLSWPDQSDCALIVQRLQQHYIEFAGSSRAATTIGAGAFLDAQIASYAKMMNNSQAALVKYKQTHAGQLPETESADIAQLQSLNAQLQDLQITQKDAVYQQQQVEALLAQTPKYLITETANYQSPYEQQISQLRSEREGLIKQGKSPIHPLVILVDKQIQDAQKQEAKYAAAHPSGAHTTISGQKEVNPEYATLQGELATAKGDQLSQNAQTQNLKQQIAQLTALVKTFPKDEKALSDKIQNYNLWQTRYNSLVNRREYLTLQGQVAAVEATSALQNISNVDAQPMTGRAKALEMFVGSIILGLIAAVLMVVLSEWADQSLRYESDAERLLGVPVLALLPDSRDLRYLPSPNSGGGGRKALAQNATKTKAALAAPANGSGPRSAATMNTTASDSRPAAEA